LEKYFHIFCWGFAIIDCIIVLVAGEINSSFSSIGCWISTDSNDLWQLGLFYIPLIVILLIGFVLIFWTIRIISTHMTLSSIQWNVYGRLIGFLIMEILNFSFLVVWKFIILNQENGWEFLYEKELVCNAAFPGSNTCSTFKISAWAAWAYAFNSSIEGILVFIFFGFNKKNIRHWKSLIRGEAYSSTSKNQGSSTHSRFHKTSIFPDNTHMGVSLPSDSSIYSDEELEGSTHEINKYNFTNESQNPSLVDIATDLKQSKESST